jgi:hypothetical protein
MLENNFIYRSEEGMQCLTDTPRETLRGLRKSWKDLLHVQEILNIVIIS